MPPIDLQVPFDEKDEAKRLGARWDVKKRVWFIPEGVSHEPFKKWLPETPTINIKADSYYIVESSKSCWKCGRPTKVFAFLLPEGHETLETAEDVGFDSDEEYEAWLNSPESLVWQAVDMLTIIHNVAYLSSDVQARMRDITLNYRTDYSKTMNSFYYMNHCECCNMKQGDFEMHCEPQGAFTPIYEAEADKMSLRLVNEPFQAYYGGYSYGVDFFDLMRKN